MTKDTPPPSVRQILTGPLFNEPMRVETVQANGPVSWVVGLVGTNSERFRKVTMTAGNLERLTVLEPQRSFNGDGRLLRLGLQAYALGIAYEFDPYFGLSISRVDPLPHQLEAIYDYLLKLEFRRGASIAVVPFPQDGAEIPDTPRLTLVVADPETEWSSTGSLRAQIAEWTRSRGKSPRLYPGALVWCLKKPGRDLREKVELALAWRRVAREVADGTLARLIHQGLF